MSSVKHLIICNGDRILVDAKNHKMAGDFVSILTRVLNNSRTAPKTNGFYVLKMRHHIFTVYDAKGISFISMCDEEYGEEMSKVFIRNVSDRFFAAYPEPGTVDYVAFQQFTDKALNIMQTFSRGGDPSDKVELAEKAIEGVAEVVKTNIDLAVKGQENLDELQARAEAVALTSGRFNGHAASLERRMCLNKLKMKAIMLLLVVFVIYCIAASFCGLSLKAC